MKKILVILTIVLFISSCSTDNNNISKTNEKTTIKTNQNTNIKYTNIKYRESPINLNNNQFEKRNTTESSFIDGLWYDKKNEYLVIKLNNTYYHYCWIMKNTWDSFKKASSYWSYYNKYIKNNFDCRKWFIPSYN